MLGTGGSVSQPSRLEASLRVARAVRDACPHAFIVLWHSAAVEDPELRLEAFACGASMVTCFAPHLEKAVGQLAGIGRSRNPGRPPAACVCAWCGQSGLTPEELWAHQPLHHIYDANIRGECCVCGCWSDNLAVHLHEEHAPGGPRREQRSGLVATVVVHRRRDNKFLMVQEFAGQGFWVPGGMVDPGESIRAGALRECLEEAGVEVELRGVVEVLYSLDRATGRPEWRCVTFYATLKGEDGGPAGAEPDSGVGVDGAAATRPGAPPAPAKTNDGAQKDAAAAAVAAATTAAAAATTIAYTGTATAAATMAALVSGCCRGRGRRRTKYAAPPPASQLSLSASPLVPSAPPLPPPLPDAPPRHNAATQPQPLAPPPQQQCPKQQQQQKQQQPKTLPCFESAGSCWVGPEQLGRVALRSPRIPTTWFPFFAAGGAPRPLALPPELAHLFADVEF